jgi:lipopolysaccharide export system permease protein
MTAAELRKKADKALHDPDAKPSDVGYWTTRLAQRYSMPFTCLVFAFIGAPLGLRHHRSSSALGLGASLLIMFVYYFISLYLSRFGESGAISPIITAWTPVVLGGALGIALTVRANQ